MSFSCVWNCKKTARFLTAKKMEEGDVNGCDIGTGCGGVANHILRGASCSRRTQRRVHFREAEPTVKRLYKHYVDPPHSAGRYQKYWVALRPWSFSASLIPVLLGTALAYKAHGTFDPTVLILSSLTAFFVHGAGNLVNTYYDYFKGIDKAEGGWVCEDRTLVDHLLTPTQVSYYGVTLYALGTIAFLALGVCSPAPMTQLAVVYFGGLSSSFMYTGGVGLKYIALGDLAIILAFGPLTVFFSFVAQSGAFSFFPLIYALPLALHTEAILHSNNARDADSDAAAGIVTLAILIGKTGSYFLFSILVFTPYAAFFVLGCCRSPWLLFPLVSLPKALELEKRFKEGLLIGLPQRTAKLNLFCGLFYVLSILMCLPENLPGSPNIS